jgi:copper(I)-binding protein
MIALLVSLALASCSAPADKPANVTVSDAWATASIPGQSSSAAYFTITNSGGDDRLTTVEVSVGKASIHSTSMSGGVMQMRPLDGIAIPAHSTVTLKPGGLHVMIVDVKRPTTAGASFPMTLRFEQSGDRTIDVTVKSAAGMAM